MKRSRSRAAGFTLVELMVSLVAGLIIAMAVVGLSKAATTTFYEEARISTVEATVRSAAERLRQDLIRASFMSTGNIRLARDGATAAMPNLRVPFGHKIAVTDPSGAASGSRYPALDNLQGIRITVGGSGSFPVADAGTAGPLGLAGANGLNPDAITIAGNLTTDDQYTGTLFAPGDLPGSPCGGMAVQLKANGDAAVRRLLTSSNPAAALQAAFTPVTGRDYAARIVDARGCQHYAVVCGVAMNVGTCAGGDTCAAVYFRDPAAGGAVVPGGATTCGGNPTEQVTVNPVHRVRWFIGPNVDPITAADPAIEPVTNKFNLYRELLDASAVPTPVPGTRQVVAEYAIDLKFGITVDQAVAGNPPNQLVVFDMDSDPGGGTGNIDQWTQNASSTTSGNPGPQRVRTVRFRVATRASIPDRAANLIVPPGAPYLSRYCIDPPACKRYARVRSLVSEVALLNQMGMSY